MRCVAVLLLIAVSARATAQEQKNAGLATSKVCAEVQHVTIPEITPRSDAEKAEFSGCDPRDLLDSATTAEQYTGVLRCALYQWGLGKHPGADDELLLDLGPLVVLYANGDGAPRSVDLAIRLVCESNSSEGELNWLILQLAASKSQMPPPKLDLCIVGIGLDKGREFRCVQQENDERERKRLAHLAAMEVKWTEPQRAAFSKAIDAYRSYAEGTASAEALSGTGRGMQMLDIADKVNEQFTKDIDQFEQGRLPSFTHDNYLAADKTLNASYREQLDYMAENKGAVTSDPSFARDAERAWLVYRDAFVGFARLHWPDVSADSWLTFLTSERTKRLENAGN